MSPVKDLSLPAMAPKSRNPLPSLDVVMQSLNDLDRAGPLTSTKGSAFAVSPVVGATLLTSAAKLAKNAEPPLMSPSSPIVWNPIPLTDMPINPAAAAHDKIFFEGQVRPVSVAAFEDLLFLTRIAKWKVAYHEGQPFSRSEQLPYFGRVDEALVREGLERTIAEIWPSDNAREMAEADKARTLADIIVSPTTPLGQVIGALQKAFELCTATMERFGGATFNAIDADQRSVFELTVKHRPDRLVIEWPASLGPDFLAALTANAEALREADKDPCFVDFVAYHIGYELLRGGAKLDTKDARWLGTPGFRKDTQTFVSLTDPGEGHIFGTTRRARWLKGAICHVEHLERPGNLPREEIESYRIPSIFEFARVRLHTGKSAPNTYFVGRRVKDSTSGTFAHDFIKVVNLTSAACSAAFQLGAAETKVAMDGLKASEQVAYMRAMSGHVLRNYKQVLSAAYNLNAPLIDDLSPPILNSDGEEVYPLITDNFEIAKRGIELASLGGFDKVTFDGASDTYPSQCVILQISVEKALELVHLAHQAGLITYMSAGFKFNHIADAVYTGVDGIGIGGAQILRYMDAETGHHGPYTEEFIDRIDFERDQAANSVRGRGVNLLCRLDRMFYEGSLKVEEDELRNPLFEALRDANEAAIEGFLTNPVLAEIIAMEHDGENPVIGNARRLMRGDVLLKTRHPDMDAKWVKLKRDLTALLKTSDEEVLAGYYRSQPWTAFREAYAKMMMTTRGDRLYTVKSAPRV
ncbi:hypothetical protein CspeluHIS016_0902720 [Cutaneotrichosporon spelunceum]|uniref:Uncharacterized protein n=1 Tax=Cutaneotrichosporon spelunceum TaxID=1672016 RepID=A0AAD3U0N1_9TREE|nr:hypothetical protein CspeluHIS016_0902720 [Cutaneotrichosporon spelunceum]